MLLRNAPWSDRESLPPAVLWWQAFTLYVNVIVFAHYRLRYTESRLRPATRDVLGAILRAAKGIAVAWEKWLVSSHVRPDSLATPATAFEQSPIRRSDHSGGTASDEMPSGPHAE